MGEHHGVETHRGEGSKAEGPRNREKHAREEERGFYPRSGRGPRSRRRRMGGAPQG